MEYSSYAMSIANTRQNIRKKWRASGFTVAREAAVVLGARIESLCSEEHHAQSCRV